MRLDCGWRDREERDRERDRVLTIPVTWALVKKDRLILAGIVCSSEIISALDGKNKYKKYVVVSIF